MFGEKLFQTKLLSRLSHKVCRLLSSPVLLRKFTNASTAKSEEHGKKGKNTKKARQYVKNDVGTKSA